ncbi:MAG: hypothetical protein ACRDAP_01815, partial [Shewanella sp.]
MQLTPENEQIPVHLGATSIYINKRAPFNYAVAMQLSFSAQAIAECTNPAQQFLLQQINSETRPFMRLKMLLIAFLGFYRAQGIRLNHCAELFNVAPATISDWTSVLLSAFTGPILIENVRQFIQNTNRELQSRGETFLTTETAAAAQASPQQQEQAASTAATQTAIPATSDYALSPYGLIHRGSLASILHPLHQALGLQWNKQAPATASASIQNQSISVDDLMEQLTLELTQARTANLAPDIQAIIQALSQAFNIATTTSAKLRILLVTASYARSMLYKRITSDLCDILGLNSRTAIDWFANFKRHLNDANPNQDLNTRLTTTISWLSNMPTLDSQRTITLIAPPDLTRQAPAQTATAATTTQHAAFQHLRQALTQVPSSPVPTPQQLLQLNLPAAQAPATTHRRATQQLKQRQHPYTRPVQQEATMVHPQQLPTTALRFSPQPQQPIAQTHTATVRFAPQPQQEHQERQQDDQQPRR